MIGATYYKEMAMALPGQVSDTSRYNIDGACVQGDTIVIPAGIAVTVEKVEADGVKKVKQVRNNTVAYGVAIRSHFATMNDNGAAVYAPADGVNVMTVGRVWMRAVSDFTPGFGTPVHIDATTGQAKQTASNTDVSPSGWTYAGGKTKFGDEYLLEVQLHQL